MQLRAINLKDSQDMENFEISRAYCDDGFVQNNQKQPRFEKVWVELNSRQNV